MAEINDIYEVKSYATLGSQAGLNVWHFLVTSKVGTGATDAQIASAFATSLAAPMKAAMASAASWRGIGVRRLRPTLSLETFDITGQGIGTVAGDPLPKQIAGIITWRSNLPGRVGRGRSYIPFPGEGNNDPDQTPSAGYLTFLTNISNQMLPTWSAGGGGNLNGLEFQIYSRNAHTVVKVTSSTVRDRWATQRRRGDYGKTNILPI